MTFGSRLEKDFLRPQETQPKYGRSVDSGLRVVGSISESNHKAPRIKTCLTRLRGTKKWTRVVYKNQNTEIKQMLPNKGY
jgi:hypothetical protein